VRCHPEAIDHMDMASRLLIIRLWVCIHLMVGHSTVLSLAQAAVASRGAEAVAGYLAAGGDSVVGGNKVKMAAWGPRRSPVGIEHSIPTSPRHEQKEGEVQ
jgi:hypothetical protein